MIVRRRTPPNKTGLRLRDLKAATMLLVMCISDMNMLTWSHDHQFPCADLDSNLLDLPSLLCCS